MIVNLGITILVACAGAFLGKKLKFPAAFMTGSMVLVIIFNFLTDLAYCPNTAKPFVQLIAGAFIAFGITKTALLEMKQIVRPLITYILCLLIWALPAGYLMHLLGGIDLLTAMLCAVPGGLTDISLLSIDMGANTPQVTTMQTLRMTMAVGLFPILTKLYVQRFGSAADKETLTQTPKEPSDPSLKKPWNVLKTFVIACIGGGIGYILGFPAATLTGAMISTGIYNVKTQKAYMPIEFRRVTQIVAGAMIGAMVTRTDLMNLHKLLIPLIILVLEYATLDFLAAPFLARVFHIDLLTMILACTPAGAADMALIAGDMGGNTSDVAVFHVLRLCSVLTVFPMLIQFLVPLLS